MRRGRVIGIVLVVCVLGALTWYYATHTPTTSTDEKPGLLGGLLPNPFGIFTPNKPTSENPGQITQPDRVTENQTGTIQTLANPVQLSVDPVIGFDAHIESTNKTITNPETGTPTTIHTNTPFVRTVHRDDGTVTDFRITHTAVVRTPLTTTIIPNIGDVLVFGNTILYRTNSTSGPIGSIGTINIPKQGAASCPVVFNRILKLGSEGRDVEYLQQLLTPYFNSTYTPGSVDASMVTALKKFQLEQNIPQTGITDTKTRTKITALCVQTETNRLHTNTAQSSPQYTVTSSSLRGIVYGFAASPDNTSIFSIKQTISGISGTITSIQKQTDTTIFALPFTEWTIQWVKSGVYLGTHASGEADGYLFHASLKTGALTPVISKVPGLTTIVQRAGDTALVSSSENQRVVTKLLNIQTRKTTDLSLSTFAEKCAWNATNTVYCFVPNNLPTATYPDQWYTHQVTTNDSLWKIDGITGTTQKITNFNESLDADMPHVLENDAGIVFRNRIDDTVWWYQL